MYSGRSSVVTGSAGFIGSALVSRLQWRAFHSVTGIDRQPSVIEAPGIGILGDLDRPAAYRHRLMGADFLWHLAAASDARVSNADMLSDGPMAMYHLLEAARASGSKPPILVYASSSVVYGEPIMRPTPEYHPLQPISLYGVAKASGELLAQRYHFETGAPTLMLRFANVVGPGCHGIIMLALRALAKNPREFVVYGDGKQTKSYIHTDDLLRLTDAIASKGADGCGALNVGSEDAIDVMEVLDIIFKEAGVTPRIVFDNPNPSGRGYPGDVTRMHLEIEKARMIYDWKPKLRSADAVRQAVRENLEAYFQRHPRSLA